jgi:hypothetical protein
MNNCYPEALQISLGKALRLHFWSIVAVVTAALTHWIFGHQPVLDSISRTFIVLAPLLPTLLFARTMARWIAGMDELQSRIQLQSWVVALAGALGLTTAISMLETVNVHPISQNLHGLGWEGAFVAVIFLHMAANVVLNRRYR